MRLSRFFLLKPIYRIYSVKILETVDVQESRPMFVVKNLKDKTSFNIFLESLFPKDIRRIICKKFSELILL